MALAVRFSSLVAGVFFLWGGNLAPAQEQAGPVLPDKSSPSTSPSTPTQPFPSFSGGGTVSFLGYVLTIVVLGAAGITVLLRGGFFGVSWGGGKAVRKLRLEETRTVGSRQHLVVAEYEGRRMLLGISPGRIEYLCGLDSEGSVGEPGFSEALSGASSVTSARTAAERKDEVPKEGK